MLQSMETTGLTLPDKKIYGMTGGSIVPIPLRRAYESKFPKFEFLVVYGTTENSPTSFMTTVDMPKKVKEETCGFPLPYTEGKIIDTKGQIVERGQIGEVCTRGYLVFQGYQNEPDKTAEVIDSSGWYHTGDLGYLTEEGALVITGRSKVGRFTDTSNVKSSNNDKFERNLNLGFTVLSSYFTTIYGYCFLLIYQTYVLFLIVNEPNLQK